MPGSTKSHPTSATNSPSRQRRIRLGFIIFHIVSILSGILMIIVPLLLRNLLEKKIVPELHLNLTRRMRVAFYTVGSVIISNSILGFFALFNKKKAYLWMTYCTILGFIVLVTFTASGSAFTLDMSVAKRNMFTLMQQYEDESRRKVVRRNVVDLIDNLQQTSQCCGVNSFMDWQDVEFGRTSLKVPRSCCKLSNVKGQPSIKSSSSSNLSTTDDLHNSLECGFLCLPNHPNSTYFLHTRGCFQQIFGTHRLIIALMGWFGLFVGLFSAIGFVLTAYLIGSNGI